MTHHIALVGVIVSCSIACSGGDSAADPARAHSVSEAPPSSASSAPMAIVISSARGGDALKLKIDGAAVDVSAGPRHVVGRTKGDKRYYHQAAGGEAFVEVKTSEAGFKLRTPDSTLLWKIKVADDKIKVSDNEENQNPWTLKTKYDDKVKVEDPTGREIGEVKFNSATGKIKVKDAADNELFSLDSDKRSAAYGVLLMSGVPEKYRDVIIAELLARGQ